MDIFDIIYAAIKSVRSELKKLISELSKKVSSLENNVASISKEIELSSNGNYMDVNYWNALYEMYKDSGYTVIILKPNKNQNVLCYSTQATAQSNKTTVYIKGDQTLYIDKDPNHYYDLTYRSNEMEIACVITANVLFIDSFNYYAAGIVGNIYKINNLGGNASYQGCPLVGSNDAVPRALIGAPSMDSLALAFFNTNLRVAPDIPTSIKYLGSSFMQAKVNYGLDLTVDSVYSDRKVFSDMFYLSNVMGPISINVKEGTPSFYRSFRNATLFSSVHLESVLAMSLDYTFAEANFKEGSNLVIKGSVNGMDHAFTGSNIKSLGVLNVASYAIFSNTFQRCSDLEELGGFVGLAQDLDLSYSPLLTRQSCLNVFNNAGTITTGKTITLHTNVYNLLSEDDKKIAVDKGWTIAHTTH